MVPLASKPGPNGAPQHWCGNCGQELPARSFNGKPLRWKFCPVCGRSIQWDYAVPRKWEPMDCAICGQPIIRKIGGRLTVTGGYIGTSICRSCMKEYCRSTNCLGCRKGRYPSCKWFSLKRKRSKKSRRRDRGRALPEAIRSPAAADFRKLEIEFTTAKGGDNSMDRFLALAEHFRAHTVERDHMDFNFGALTATAYRLDGIITLGQAAEIWDDQTGKYFGNYTHKQLTEMASA